MLIYCDEEDDKMKVNINGLKLETKTATTEELKSLIEDINKLLKVIDTKLKIASNIKNSKRRHELILNKMKLEKILKECTDRIEMRNFKRLVGARGAGRKKNKKPKQLFPKYDDCYTHKSVKAIVNNVGGKR